VADFVDSTVRDIDRRLDELKGEVQKLEAARSALVGGGARRGPGRPAGSRNGSGRSSGGSGGSGNGAGRPRGRRGGNTRANQALQLVKERPGVTIPDIAESLGIEPNYLYRVMPQLVQEGAVKREGQGWHPVSED
jgi:hypothetical protein